MLLMRVMILGLYQFICSFACLYLIVHFHLNMIVTRLRLQDILQQDLVVLVDSLDRVTLFNVLQAVDKQEGQIIRSHSKQKRPIPLVVLVSPSQNLEN